MSVAIVNCSADRPRSTSNSTPSRDVTYRADGASANHCAAPISHEVGACPVEQAGVMVNIGVFRNIAAIRDRPPGQSHVGDPGIHRGKLGNEVDPGVDHASRRVAEIGKDGDVGARQERIRHDPRPVLGQVDATRLEPTRERPFRGPQRGHHGVRSRHCADEQRQFRFVATCGIPGRR
jgi:hypothetical protein